MDKLIRAVFEDACSGLDIGRELAKKIHAYQVGFVNKNPEHTQFFGGNLTGVHIVRFTDDDRNRWFSDILKVEPSPLEARLHELPDVNPEFHISSDVMNLSCAWLLHAIDASALLNDKQKHTAKVDVLLVLQYKYLTSLLFHYFRYPADKSTAEATYEQLSFKYALKVSGSWGALLLARCEDVLAPRSIHHETIRTMDDDKQVVYLLNDAQGRIRDMLKNIYSVFLEVSRSGMRHQSTSAVVEHDGVEILRDRMKSLESYGRYISSVVTDENSFIREELTVVIERIMHTMSPTLFQMSLQWMSHHYSDTGNTVVDDVLKQTLVHSFDYLSTHRALVRDTHDLPKLLSTLRGVYMSSRSTDPSLLLLREKTEGLVVLATKNKNSSAIASVRTGVLLYIVLRSFTMRHYVGR